MPNVFSPSSARRVLLCAITLFAAGSAHAQVTEPVTALSRQLSHVDLGVSGMGEFTNSVTGVNYLGTKLTQQPSNTLGALVTIRYTKSPYLGAEFNYSYARYTQNFSSYITGGAQTNASEYTLGYVAHTPRILGIQTFAAAGLGSIAFRATPGGGQGLPTQARAAYYYNAGFEDSIFSPHFGIRAGFRQVFFLAPDFGQNYLTIKQRQISTEPNVGFYLHF
jgi:opacity protein-like surface antigen